jgi:hypothetical protein
LIVLSLLAVAINGFLTQTSIATIGPEWKCKLTGYKVNLNCYFADSYFKRPPNITELLNRINTFYSFVSIATILFYFYET